MLLLLLVLVPMMLYTPQQWRVTPVTPKQQRVTPVTPQQQ